MDLVKYLSIQSLYFARVKIIFGVPMVKYGFLLFRNITPSLNEIYC